jgi:membrane-bound lytic murein transglycosylase F
MRRLLVPAAMVLLLCGCEQRDSLADIKARGALVVVTRNSPTTYYIGKDGPTGFEYALTQLLAEELGVDLRVKTVFNLPAIFKQLRRAEADIAAAGLTLTDERAAVYPPSASYYLLTPQVIYVAGHSRPRNVADLTGMRLAALQGSSHVERLRKLRGKEAPDLKWTEVDEADTLQLLELLKAGKADVAIVDSNEFAVQQSLYPRQKVAFNLGAEQEMVWYLPPDIDNARLLALINSFFARLKEDGTLERLRDQYFGHADGVTRMNAFAFAQAIQTTLPRHRALIKQVAGEYQLDWHLLAAMAYQESQWNPKAASPTGVRGMMMLTRPTALELGVVNRLDATESLRGGARYFKELMRRLPKGIGQPDRTWMALAAYNVGLGHLEDARVLTQRQGGDPNRWQDVESRLPLLQQSRYYKTTRYGYARGQEAVTLVKNIRQYYSVLAWRDITVNRPVPPLPSADYFPGVVKGLDFSAL